MVAAANPPRTRAANSSAPTRNTRISAGTAVIVGVPVLLLLMFVWQIASSVLRTEIAVRDAVAVSRVSLEPDPIGTRVNLVLVDRLGQETTVNGNLNLKLREPDGTVWQTTRAVSAGDFTPINGGLLTGRLGYSLTVPASDWLRAPRRGGSATITVSVEPAEGSPFTTVAEERFP